jgi:DNA polymerase-3 subunit gamma/tau
MLLEGGKMNYKVLYRKYRPQDFNSVVGQEFTTRLLKNAIIDGKISHSYIFTGPRGTGKTSSARIFAKAINCLNPKDGNPCNECEMCKNFSNNPDIVEIDAASNNGVDEMRELINNIRLAPTNSKYKVYIIDEFHMLSTSAFNALLLTLEEPPSNVVFILATTDIQNVPITILSRCQRFDFKLISYDVLMERLKYICQEEKIDITSEAISEIAYLSSGGLRDALSLLDQISSMDGKITDEMVSEMFGSVSLNNIKYIIEIMEQNDAKELIKILEKFKSDGINYNVLSTKLINQLKQSLIDIKSDNYLGKMDFMNVYNIIMDINKLNTELNNNLDPYDLLEIILLKYIGNDDIHPQSKEISNNINLQKSQEEKNVIKSNNTETIIKDEIKMSESKQTFDINVRINNCFALANKAFLNKYKETWNDFIIYESNANKKLLSYILDTSIVVASDQYSMITNSLESTVNLINENISSLEGDFKKFYGNECKLVAITGNKWNEIKLEYVNNIKNGNKYSIINEKISDDSNTESVNDENKKLEALANEIFGNNVEIK